MLQIIRKLFGNQRDQDALVPLYNAAVAAAREPHWFVAGQVPDTVDGRFDVLISVLSLALVRMEQLPGQEQNSVWLTELFIEDMDGQLRQIGVGDHGVGKHVGKIMGALGGRLEAFRETLATGDALDPLVLRNIYTDEQPDAAVLAHTVGALHAHWAALQNVDAQDLLAGEIGA
jgi:cytochrome b pre-mRNA-processing protein 3